MVHHTKSKHHFSLTMAKDQKIVDNKFGHCINCGAPCYIECSKCYALLKWQHAPHNCQEEEHDINDIIINISVGRVLSNESQPEGLRGLQDDSWFSGGSNHKSKFSLPDRF